LADIDASWKQRAMHISVAAAVLYATPGLCDVSHATFGTVEACCGWDSLANVVGCVELVCGRDEHCGGHPMAGGEW